MQEQLISFKTAVLAKEKGFIKHTNFRYMSKDIEGCLAQEGDLTTLAGADIPAPTQSLLQKWLREVHNISIKIDDFYTDGVLRYDYSTAELGSQEDNPTGIFETYEEALEYGLLEALKLIK